MTAYIPHNLPHDLAADQWRRPKREEPGPNAEAWLRKHVGPYREARERMEHNTPGARPGRGEG